MAFLVGLVSPEQDSVIICRRGNHEGRVGNVISNVAVSAIVNRGHVGLGKFNVVNAQIIDFTIHAVVVVDSLRSAYVEVLVNGANLRGAVGLPLGPIT